MNADAKDGTNDDGEAVGADQDEWMESPEARAHPSLVRSIASENGDVAAFSNNDGEALTIRIAEQHPENQEKDEQ